MKRFRIKFSEFVNEVALGWVDWSIAFHMQREFWTKIGFFFKFYFKLLLLLNRLNTRAVLEQF